MRNDIVFACCVDFPLWIHLSPYLGKQMKLFFFRSSLASMHPRSSRISLSDFFLRGRSEDQAQSSCRAREVCLEVLRRNGAVGMAPHITVDSQGRSVLGEAAPVGRVTRVRRPGVVLKRGFVGPARLAYSALKPCFSSTDRPRSHEHIQMLLKASAC